MILLFHIIIATSSLIATGLAFFYPSRLKLNVSIALVGFTLASGFFLIASKPSHLTQTCIEGLIYLGVVSYGIIAARNKLVSAK